VRYIVWFLPAEQSEQRFKPRFLEVTVILERLPDAEPAHHGKRYVVDDSGLSGAAMTIFASCLAPVLVCGKHEHVVGFHSFSQSFNRMAIGTPGCGIGTFQQDERGRCEWYSVAVQFGEDGFGLKMPLVIGVPESEQTNRIEKSCVHG
jgi:hypothetical protein